MPVPRRRRRGHRGEAVAAARDAEVCLAALGDIAGLFGVGTSGEGCDAVDLRLPVRQEDRVPAAVCAFFPSEEGGPALADMLSGRVNPPWPGALLSVPPHNGSDRDSSEVVQVYLHDAGRRGGAPGAAADRRGPRVDLAAGGPARPRWTRTPLAAYAGLGRQRVVEPGDVELWVGASSTDIRARPRLSVTGRRRTAGYDRMMQPEITILPRHITPEPRQARDPIVVDNGFRG